MASLRFVGWCGLATLVVVALPTFGCRTAPDYSDYAQGPAPLRMPPPSLECPPTYEDSLSGGQVFAMYCAGCHNARKLAERPFSDYRNVVAHMSVRANLTGKERAKLLEFMRRWHDVPPPMPPVATDPKRLVFSQPITQLRPEQQTPEELPPPSPEETNSGEPSPGPDFRPTADGR